MDYKKNSWYWLTYQQIQSTDFVCCCIWWPSVKAIFTNINVGLPEYLTISKLGINFALCLSSRFQNITKQQGSATLFINSTMKSKMAGRKYFPGSYTYNKQGCISCIGIRDCIFHQRQLRCLRDNRLRKR